MPTPEQIAKARSLLAGGNLSPDVAKRLRAAIGDPEPSAQPEPEHAADGGETEQAAPAMPSIPDRVADELGALAADGDEQTSPPLSKNLVARETRRAKKPAEKPWYENQALQDASFGWLNGVTLGHAEDIAGLFMDDDEAERFKRDYRSEDALAREQHPKTHFWSGIAGGAAPGALVSTFASPAATGAILGGIQGHGDTDDGDVDEMALRVALGAGGGAAIGKGLQVGAPYVKKFAGWAGGKAGDWFRLGEKMLGRGMGATEKQVAEDQATGRLGDIIRTLRGAKGSTREGERDVLGGLPTKAQIGDRATDEGNLIMSELEALADDAGDVVVPPRAVAKEMLKERRAYGTGAGQKFRDRIRDAAREVFDNKQKNVPNPELEQSGARVTEGKYTDPNGPEYTVDAEPVPPPKPIPKNAEAAAQQDEADNIIWESFSDDAPDSPPPSPPSGKVDDILYGEVMPQAEPGNPEVAGSARVVQPMRRGIPMNEALKERTVWGRQTNWEGDDLGNEVKGKMYGAWNRAMEGAMDSHAGAGKVWRNLNWNLGAMRTAQDWSQQATPQPAGIIGQVVNPIVRAALFGRQYQFGSMGANAVRGAYRGAQLGAAHAGRVMGGELGRGAVPGAVSAAEGAAGRSLTGNIGNQIGSATSKAIAQYREDQTRQADESQRVQGEAVGWKSPQVMSGLLKTNPQVFGGYLQAAQRAEAQQDPAAWSALLEKMDRDPAFRRTQLKTILQLTKGQQQ